MERQKIIMICEEFPTHHGGVSYFSDVLAKKYQKEGLLKGVVSLSKYAPASRSFNIIHLKSLSRAYGKWPLDNIFIFRKINSLIFKSIYHPKARILNKLKNTLNEFQYDPSLDILFFTYQVHFPFIFRLIYDNYQGEQWILYHGLDLLAFRKYPQEIQKNCDVAARILFNSKATKSVFHKHGYKAERTEVIYPFLDTEYLDSLQLLPLQELETKTGLDLRGKILITSICRLVKRKGIHFAIEIVEELISKNKTILYLIAGTGPEEENLKLSVSEKGLKKYIHFLGYVDDHFKYSLLDHSSVFLMPNYDVDGEDFEGFGISFLEASYFDNFIIGGSHGGALESLKFASKNIAIEHNDSGKEMAIKKIEEIVTSHAV